MNKDSVHIHTHLRAVGLKARFPGRLERTERQPGTTDRNRKLAGGCTFILVLVGTRKSMVPARTCSCSRVNSLGKMALVTVTSLRNTASVLHRISGVLQHFILEPRRFTWACYTFAVPAFRGLHYSS